LRLGRPLLAPGHRLGTPGLGHFALDISPWTSPPEKNVKNVVEIEAGMIKQYFSSTS